jgi:hypothetical protein
MRSMPDPARLGEYQAKLAELLAEREGHRARDDDQKVKLLNRRIRAQSRWIKRARAISRHQTG